MVDSHGGQWKQFLGFLIHRVEIIWLSSCLPIKSSQKRQRHFVLSSFNQKWSFQPEGIVKPNSTEPGVPTVWRKAHVSLRIHFMSNSDLHVTHLEVCVSAESRGNCIRLGRSQGRWGERRRRQQEPTARKEDVSFWQTLALADVTAELRLSLRRTLHLDPPAETEARRNFSNKNKPRSVSPVTFSLSL